MASNDTADCADAPSGTGEIVRSACRWIAVAAFAGLVSGCGPIWYFDPTAAERIARQENKPLLLYFRAWDSELHRNMRLHVFEDSAVSKELLGTVNAELEFAYFPDYRNRYGVQRPQVCVMCTPDGAKVYTALPVNPVPKPEQFLEWIQAAKAQAMPPPPTSAGEPPRTPSKAP